MRAPVLVFLLVLGCGSSPPAPPAPAPVRPTVIVISLDGFRYDYPERTRTPALDRMEREGARADRLLPPFPSQTFPAHATLATGVTPRKHGIVNNRFFDRERGAFDYADDVAWYDRPPLWIHAERRGIRTHVFHWVGSQGAYEGVRPTEARAFDPAITDDTKVDTILEWLALPPAQRPGLIMSYFAGCDHPAHELGPESEEVTACVADTDERLGRLIAGIEAQAIGPVSLFVVSDHGMTATRGEVDIVGRLAPLGVEVWESGPIAHVFVTRPIRRDELVGALEALPHTTIYEKDTLPEWLFYGHPTRTGDFLAVADYGWHYHGKAAADAIHLPGHHGHDPAQPEMGAVFYAWGHGIRPGAAPAQARAVDLVPTLCRLLGIPPPEGVDGQVIEGLLDVDQGSGDQGAGQAPTSESESSQSPSQRPTPSPSPSAPG